MRWLLYLFIVILIVGGIWFFLSSESSDNSENVPARENSNRGQTSSLEESALYTNSAYGVSLNYPRSWQPDQPEGVAGAGVPIRFVGEDGFFSVDALGAAESSLDEVVRDLTTHRLEPYGSNPTVVKTKIDGQEAAYIFPSADQPSEAQGEAVLIVRYSQPTRIEVLPGDFQTYNFFVLYADQEHIESIGQTLKFTD